MNRSAEFCAQAWACHGQQILGDFTGWELQIVHQRSEDAQDFVFAVDQDGGRRVLAQDQTLHQFLEAVGGGLRRFGIRDARAATLFRRHARDLYQIAPDGTEPPEHAPLLRHGLEQVHFATDRFGRSQQQVSVFGQREMKEPDDLGLYLGLQIDQQVAAGDQVQFRERRIAH